VLRPLIASVISSSNSLTATQFVFEKSLSEATSTNHRKVRYDRREIQNNQPCTDGLQLSKIKSSYFAFAVYTVANSCSPQFWT
jgi:hypothetical protein